MVGTKAARLGVIVFVMVQSIASEGGTADIGSLLELL